MKPVLRIVLVVSLAFNIFFVLGFVQAGKQEKRAKTLEGRARIMAAKLELDQQLGNRDRLGDLVRFAVNDDFHGPHSPVR